MLEQLINNSDTLKLLYSYIKDYNNETDRKIYISSLYNFSIPKFSKRTIAEEGIEDNLIVKNRIESFRGELISFLKHLSDFQFKSFYDKFPLNNTKYDINKLSDYITTEYKKAFVDLIVEKAEDESELARESLNIRKENYFANAKTTSSLVDITFDYMNAIALSNSDKSPKDALQAFIYRLNSESDSYKIGKILEKIYDQIEENDVISSEMATALIMRVNGVLPYISNQFYQNIASFMFNNYNWMKNKMPMNSYQIIEKIKSEFKNMIYIKNPDNRIGNFGEFMEEYSNTGGDSSLNANSSLALNDETLLDSFIKYLLDSDKEEYRILGRNFLNMIIYLDCSKENPDSYNNIKELFQKACKKIDLSLVSDYYDNHNYLKELSTLKFIEELEDILAQRYNKTNAKQLSLTENMQLVDKVELFPSKILDSFNKAMAKWKKSHKDDELEPKVEQFIIDAFVEKIKIDE